jgi:hypothetical protein
MSVIIFFMAASFSARNEVSAMISEAGAPQMSTPNAESNWAEPMTAVPMTQTIANVIAVGVAKRRVSEFIPTLLIMFIPIRSSAMLAQRAFGKEVSGDPTLRISGTNHHAPRIERSLPYFNLLSGPTSGYGTKSTKLAEATCL